MDPKKGEKPTSAVSGTASAFEAADRDADEDQPRSSASNVIPTEQLANGFNQAKGMFLRGWSTVVKTAKDIEQSEQVAKIKESAGPLVAKAGTGLCTVGQKVGDATMQGVKWTGEKLEEAKPILVDMKDKTVAATKDLSKEVQKRVGGKGGDNNGSGTGSGGGFTV